MHSQAPITLLSLDAKQFISRAVQYGRSLSKEEKNLAFSQPNNPDSASNPVKTVTDDGVLVTAGAGVGCQVQGAKHSAVRMVTDAGSLVQLASDVPLVSAKRKHQVRMVTDDGKLLQRPGD